MCPEQEEEQGSGRPLTTTPRSPKGRKDSPRSPVSSNRTPGPCRQSLFLLSGAGIHT